MIVRSLVLPEGFDAEDDGCELLKSEDQRNCDGRPFCNTDPDSCRQTVRHLKAPALCK